jgi:hypothetical protein
MLLEPDVWLCLGNSLRLDARRRRVWWGALTDARWSLATRGRQRLWLFEGQPEATMPVEAVLTFWQHSISPQEVIAVLERVVAERRLHAGRSVGLRSMCSRG